MENSQGKRNYSGYRPKASNVSKLELYLKEAKKPTTGNKMQNVRASRVLKNKRF